MAERHKHADLIIAWANGAEIQGRHPFGEWEDFTRPPNWYDHYEYRIKPEPDVVKYGYLSEFSRKTHWSSVREEDNIKAVFDGETGRLKSIEILQ